MYTNYVRKAENIRIYCVWFLTMVSQIKLQLFAGSSLFLIYVCPRFKGIST